MSKALGPLTLELTAGTTFFTDNTNFLGGKTRSQDPIYSSRAMPSIASAPAIWASLDATYFTGGRTTIDGEANNDLQRNWRLGATLHSP